MDLFQSCDHCWVFQIYSHYICHSLLLFFSSLWVANPAVMRFDLMWLCPSCCLIVASLLCITLSKSFWNLNHLLIPKWKHTLVIYRKNPNLLAWHERLQRKLFSLPTDSSFFLPCLFTMLVCTWIATTLKSWSHLRLPDKTSSLCGAFPVYSSSFL